MTRPRLLLIFTAAVVACVIGAFWVYWPRHDSRFVGTWEVIQSDRNSPGRRVLFDLMMNGEAEQWEVDPEGGGWSAFYWSGSSSEFTIGDVRGPIDRLRREWQYLRAPGMGRPKKAERFRIKGFSTRQIVLVDREEKEIRLLRISAAVRDTIVNHSTTNDGVAGVEAQRSPVVR